MSRASDVGCIEISFNRRVDRCSKRDSDGEQNSEARKKPQKAVVDAAQSIIWSDDENARNGVLLSALS